MGKLIGEGITFDDVLLVPAFSEVIANDVDTRTRLTNKIRKRKEICYIFFLLHYQLQK